MPDLAAPCQSAPCPAVLGHTQPDRELPREPDDDGESNPVPHQLVVSLPGRAQPCRTAPSPVTPCTAMPNPTQSPTEGARPLQGIEPPHRDRRHQRDRHPRPRGDPLNAAAPRSTGGGSGHCRSVRRSATAERCPIRTAPPIPHR